VRAEALVIEDVCDPGGAGGTDELLEDTTKVDRQQAAVGRYHDDMAA
jgi:hypothetical protein